MANTKISQLPSYTGSAADIRYFVMNNSGETTTYKFSGYTSQLIPGTGTDSYRTINAVGAAGTNSIAIGKGAAASGNDSICIGDIGSSISSSAGTNSVIIGKHAQATGNYQTIIGNATYGSGNFVISIGSENASYAPNAIVVGNYSRATGTQGITIGNNNDRNIGEYSIILGNNNRIAEAPNFYGGVYNVVIGNNSWINNSVNGIGYNSIIGGFGNYITGTTSGATLVGLRNFTEPTLNDTAYVDNLQVLRTPSTKVQPVSSGTTFTCNLDNGAKSQFYITGTSTINITSVRDGASFMIKTQTDGNHTITWTATGYTFVFEGGIKDPGNNVTDIFVFEVFGSVIYGNRRHNYS